MATSNNSNRSSKRWLPVKSAIKSEPMTLSSLPSRPAQPSSSGRQQTLYTNHFPCTFSKNLPLYQYDVIVENLDSDEGKWFEIKGRARCALAMQEMVSSRRFPQGVVVWYDEQRCLYSTSNLPTPMQVVSADGSQRIQIKSLANAWSTNDIVDYIERRATTYPFDAVRILETLLKKSIQDQVHVVNNTCYFTNVPAKKLSGGFEERIGFTQALNLSSKIITLNVQTKLTTFYSEMPLLDFIEHQLGHDKIPDAGERRKLSKVLKHCKVVTRQSEWKKSYKIERFIDRIPEEICIQDGKNLVEYYAANKNINLKYPQYPCIEVHDLGDRDDLCHLPVEVCLISGWQVYDKPLAKANEANQPRKFIPNPNERYDDIMRVIRTCNYNSPQNQLCRAVDFRITDNEMMTLNARVLNQPSISTGPNHSANVRFGRISLNGYMFTPKPLTNLAVTYFGTNLRQNGREVDNFTRTLLNVMRNYYIDADYQRYNCGVSSEEIDQHFHAMQQQGCQFVLCVMDGRNDDELQQLKTNIKQISTTKFGIMTQCALMLKIRTNRSLTTYCENLLRKINLKNGGINTVVNLNTALGKKKSAEDLLMFFGADVIHPTNVTRQHPSIAAVVGSGDSLCSTTAVRVCQQYPPTGKCSIETILGMTNMVEELLDYYGEANGLLPNKIVFYRDGVDDGQFGKLLHHEIPCIREAFNSMYGDKANHPLLTFIVVKKRHNTRFFTYNRSANETNNMPIGSVIDTTIVHPYQNNYFLNSHNAFQGVNHPSLYHVILDEIGFTTDELQLLTYHLCYTDPRSAASEAIPSVLHQADIAALKARDLFYDDDSSSTTSGSESNRPIENPTLDDVTHQILEVHEKLKNLPALA